MFLNRSDFDHFQQEEIRKGLEKGIDLTVYVDAGYDSEQLAAIRYALEKGINIDPYLNTAYHGSCITEIAIGLKHNINVTPYADTCYTWRKMREIRLGIEHHLDISQYANPLYSYWQMREIRLGLEEGLDVSYYKSLMFTVKEMHKRRLKLEETKNVSQIFGEWTIISERDYDIKISPDGINAFFDWHCKHPIKSVQELEYILHKNGIMYGIDYRALEEIVKEYSFINEDSKPDLNTLIAKGTEAVHGKDGYYEWFFNKSADRLPHVGENGCTDFEGIKWFEPVSKGQTLAVYHFATKAIEGKAVTGIPIPARAGKEMESLIGQGFDLLPDLKTYVAAKDGHVRFCKKKLIVTDLIIIDELNSSNIPFDFNGDVYVKGNITGPAEIIVNGDLEVDGYVEGSQIACTGNVLLKRGINDISGDGFITANGCIVSKFFEYVTIHADKNIYFGASLNSNLSAYGEIIAYGNKGGIIGGSSYAEKGYCLPNLGNAAGAETTLLLGAYSQQARDCFSKIIVEQQIFENVQVCCMDKKITAIPSSHVEILLNKGRFIMEKLHTYDAQSA